MAAAYNEKEENYSSDENNYDENTCGYSFCLLNKGLEEKFTCIICGKIIREFVEIPCKKGHASCQYCLEKWEEQKDKGKETRKCFLCQKEYNKKDKNPVVYMDQWITENAHYKCKRSKRGCNWEGTINDYYRDHKNECTYRKERCPNAPCLKTIQRRNMNEHVTKECLYRPKTCTFCHLDYIVAMEIEHERTECFISCTNAGCTTRVTRNNITEHEIECGYAIIPCKYVDHGCEHKIRRNGMNEHIRNDAEIHMNLVIGRLNQKDVEMQKLKEEISHLKAYCQKMKWNGTIIHEVKFEGNALKFEDVYTMLDQNEFERFDRLLHTTPQLLNSLRHSNFNSSLLMEAAQDEKRNIFKKLLEHPQDFAILNNGGWNVFHYVACYQNDSWWFDELKKNIYNANELKELVNNNDDGNGWTSLHCAACNQKYESVRWLLANGADVNVTNNFGQRADDLSNRGEIKLMIRDYRN